MNYQTIIIVTALLFSNLGFAAIDKKSFSDLKPAPIVAVIDTGVDVEHLDLKNFLWTNPGESGKDLQGHDKKNNLIDDDDNGFIDDVHGWNFVENNNQLKDVHGHGTHIAGIIKNEYERQKSSHEKMKPVQLMILKYYSESAKNQDNILFSVKAIQYATKMRAQIINYSGGGNSSSYAEQKAIEESRNQNILFVAAAGNNKSNTDLKSYYPANYHLSNIISVAASDNGGNLVGFSNFGQSSVDIAAPGQFIISTLPKNKYGIMSGTSQATAFVSGAAAAVMAKKQSPLLPKQILAELLKNSKFNKSLIGKTKFQAALLSE